MLEKFILQSFRYLLADMHIAVRSEATTALAGGMRQCSNLYPGDKVAGAIASYAGSCLRMRPAAVQTQAADARRIAGLLQPERDAS